jgi:2-hydroxy-6-oxonona-2,4-dienedioate hydrolase
MRFAFAIFLALHGFAHLVGFLGPWGVLPAQNGASNAVNALFGGRVVLGMTASRGLAFLWLAMGLAFAVVAIGWWQGNPWSLRALIAVAAVSLLLNIAWWPVARVGVFINAAILLGVLVLGYRRYAVELADARARALSGGAVIPTAAGPREYAAFGSGEPVLVVHGTGGGWDQGLYAARGLAPFGFHLIAPSRFGYLRTPMPAAHGPADEADAFAALLDTMGIRRVTVMSFSAGAAPALQFALRHPERVSALVLVVPAAGGILATTPEGPPAWVMRVLLRFDLPMWLAMRFLPQTVSNIVAVPYALLDSLPPAALEQYREGVRLLLPIAQRRRGMMNDARNQTGVEGVYPLDRVTVPTLLVSAEDDLYQTLRVARAAAGRIPGARVIAVESGGHLLLGRGDEIWPQVAAFLHAVIAPHLLAGDLHQVRPLAGAIQ